MYYRISEPHNPLVVGPGLGRPRHPATTRPWAGNNATYANLFRMPDGRLYNFIRAFHHDPNYMFSDDDGQTWKYGGRWLYGKGGYSPYLKYADDGKGTIHFVATEDHPRNFDNSLYHGYRPQRRDVQDRRHARSARSARRPRRRSRRGTSPNSSRGRPTTSPGWWTSSSIATDRPYVLFSTQNDGRGLPRGQGGMDLRYHYARLDAAGAWHHEEIALRGHGGSIRGEDDYSGLGALDPNNPDVALHLHRRRSGQRRAAGQRRRQKRHYELFRGERGAGGKWTWTPFTRNSALDNLRPVIPKWNDPRTAMAWMRGAYVAQPGRVVLGGRRRDHPAEELRWTDHAI